MRGAPCRGEAHAQITARRRRQSVVRRLAIDQELALIRNRVRRGSAVAAPLLTDDKQQTDASLAIRAQPLARRYLCRKDAFGVASTATVKATVLDATRKKRRHAIKVGGEDHGGVVERG